ELAKNNSLRRKALIEDLKWAVTANPPAPELPEAAILVKTREDAEEAVRVLKSQGCSFMDIESYGSVYKSDYTVLCVSAATLDAKHSYVWDTRDKSSEALLPLLRFLQDASVAKGGTNFKYDIRGLEYYFGVRVLGKLLDTRLIHKLVDN